MYTPTEHEEVLATAIVNAAFAVHTYLGPGLLESVYEKCLCYELRSRGIPFRSQKRIPLVYKGEVIDNGLQFDLLVDDRVLCELKSVEATHPIYLAQILSLLRLADLHLGFLINFNVVRIKDGIRRIIRS
ncbi:MAG: GxxExxY protein [Acidobacteriota bacterium]|nr:GxxExxY protein [Acidobacteriota bacterium]